VRHILESHAHQIRSECITQHSLLVLMCLVLEKARGREDELETAVFICREQSLSQCEECRNKKYDDATLYELVRQFNTRLVADFVRHMPPLMLDERAKYRHGNYVCEYWRIGGVSCVSLFLSLSGSSSSLRLHQPLLVVESSGVKRDNLPWVVFGYTLRHTTIVGWTLFFEAFGAMRSSLNVLLQPTRIQENVIDLDLNDDEMSQHHHQQEEEQQQECLVCLSEKANTTAFPCMHKVVCVECSDQLASTSNQKKCIMCRAHITEIHFDDGRVKRI